MKQETWYLLADGTHADPKDVSTGKDGVLRHKNGVPVAMRDSGVPHTLGVDATLNKNVEAAAAGTARPDAGKAEPDAAALANKAAETSTATDDGQHKSSPKGSSAAKPKAKSANYKDREMKRR